MGPAVLAAALSCATALRTCGELGLQSGAVVLEQLWQQGAVLPSCTVLGHCPSAPRPVMEVPCEQPFGEEQARLYFRDIVLGIEYCEYCCRAAAVLGTCLCLLALTWAGVLSDGL